IARLDAGIEKAVKLFDGRIPTYFTFEPTAYDEHVNKEEQRIYVSVKGFKAHPLPRFLEGPARYLSMKAESGNRTAADAGKVHMDVLSSGLYDSKLKMFKTSEPIEELSLQYGRIRAFTPGWLERESIFLHMEYKYLYALLKNSLYDEFYDAMKTAFIPFMDPGVYGRSILENSSFIASSANPDERVHGRGFVARLSGSTTEVISMYIRMFAGERLFTTGENGLEIRFAPALRGSFFKEDGTASWTFMGQCRIVYHNASRRSTYGDGAARITSMKLLTTQGKVIESEGDTLSGEYAEMLRAGGIVRIDAVLE
ncbi:MAG: cellobiose phosphorylase, partial [Lachnospiraceae bacterium]|nr:cellobiose phosphorylase [Lachnospiraceae bacterium]